jgi:hypothetical protein
MHPTHPVSQLMYEVMHGDGDGHVNSPLRKSKHKNSSSHARVARPSPKKKPWRRPHSSHAPKSMDHGSPRPGIGNGWIRRAPSLLNPTRSSCYRPPAKGEKRGSDRHQRICRLTTLAEQPLLIFVSWEYARFARMSMAVCALTSKISFNTKYNEQMDDALSSENSPWNSVAPSSYIQAFHKGPPAAT